MQTIKISRGIYSMEPLLKTAYSFTNLVYIHLSQEEQHWIVSWEPKDGVSLKAQEFENELIQQQTRQLLEQKTAETRKMIIARALASTIIDRSNTEVSPPLSDESSEEETETILKGWHEVHDQI